MIKYATFWAALHNRMYALVVYIEKTGIQSIQCCKDEYMGT